MKVFKLFSVLACTLFVSTSVGAQPAQNAKEFKPEVGQQGKDVVWVPTSLALVNKMLDMAKATPSDYLIDLGSGDGRYGNHRSQARRQGAGHRIQPGHGGVVQARRSERGCNRARDLY